MLHAIDLLVERGAQNITAVCVAAAPKASPLCKTRPPVTPPVVAAGRRAPTTPTTSSPAWATPATAMAPADFPAQPFLSPLSGIRLRKVAAESGKAIVKGFQSDGELVGDGAGGVVGFRCTCLFRRVHPGEGGDRSGSTSSRRSPSSAHCRRMSAIRVRDRPPSRSASVTSPGGRRLTNTIRVVRSSAARRRRMTGPECGELEPAGPDAGQSGRRRSRPVGPRCRRTPPHDPRSCWRWEALRVTQPRTGRWR